MQTLLEQDALQAYRTYTQLLNEVGEEDSSSENPELKGGLARELARISLNLNYNTQWYWKIDLHNLMHFLALRADPHAEYEIRVDAEVIVELFSRWLPLTHEAFRDHRFERVHLSRSALKIVRRLVQGQSVRVEDSGLSR